MWHVWENRNTCRLLVGKSEGNSHLGDLTIDERQILKWIVKNAGRMG
jgi:hypothetical protein